jgi:hypothetical protein
MKIANWILVVIFVFFAALQYNDPDALLWIVAYGMIAVFAGLNALGKYYPLPIGVWAMACLGGAVYLSPGVYDWFANHTYDEIFETMQPDKVFIEEARECFGLLFAFGVLVFLYFQAKKAHPKQMA